MLMEVQALCSPVHSQAGAPPMRMPSGVDRQRLALLLAVLGKHTDLRPYSVDLHLNVTGGGWGWVGVVCVVGGGGGARMCVWARGGDILIRYFRDIRSLPAPASTPTPAPMHGGVIRPGDE